VWAYWDGPPAHAALVERVGRACAEAGIVPADQRAGDGARPHIPHTTLARFCNDVLVRELRSLPRSGLEREHLVVDRFALWETLRNGASGVCRVLGSRRLAR
jgi:2'-5' RNA ligase